MRQFLLGVFVSIIIFGLVAGAYFFGKNSNSATPSPTPAEQEVPLATPSTDTQTATESAQPQGLDPQAAIALAISAKSYADLESAMADTVTVRIESSGCCEPQTPAGAAIQLKYLDAAQPPWVFSKTNSVVLQLAAKSPDYWGTSKIVGLSADKYAVSFGLNAEDKIDTISMVVNYDLILNQ